jgi:hypothetical protein
MPPERLARRQQEALKRQAAKYEDAKSPVADLGFVLQGSVVERWMECGKPACRCHEDPAARHGPYYQWSWKTRGKTHAVYLTDEQAAQCRQWVKNNRRLDKIVKRLRTVSLRAASLYGIRRK